MLGEVVADEYVEQVGVAAQVGVGEHDQLPLAGGAGQRRWPGRGGCVSPVSRAAATRTEAESVVGGQGEDLVGGVGVAADEAVEEGGLVIGHRTTVARGADGALTAG